MADPTAEQWIEAFAAAAGADPPTPEELDALLGLASVAAHASERRAAPIACWIAARAGLDPAASKRLAESIAAAEK